MATYRMSILGFGFQPDASGNVFVEPSTVKDANDLFPRGVIILNDTATKIGFSGKFPVPVNYVGGAKFVAVWKSTATSGDVENDLDYTSIAAGETLDPAGAQESLNQNDTAPGTARLRADNELSATAGNFAANDECIYTFYRDGTDGGDTMAAAQILEDLLFEWTDA